MKSIEEILAEVLARERYGSDRYTEEYFLDLSEVRRDAFVEGYLKAKEDNIMKKLVRFFNWLWVELKETSRNAPKETRW